MKLLYIVVRYTYFVRLWPKNTSIIFGPGFVNDIMLFIEIVIVADVQLYNRASINERESLSSS